MRTFHEPSGGWVLSDWDILGLCLLPTGKRGSGKNYNPAVLLLCFSSHVTGSRRSDMMSMEGGSFRSCFPGQEKWDGGNRIKKKREISQLVCCQYFKDILKELLHPGLPGERAPRLPGLSAGDRLSPPPPVPTLVTPPRPPASSQHCSN